jgi:Borrelia P83/100 protein
MPSLFCTKRAVCVRLQVLLFVAGFAALVARDLRAQPQVAESELETSLSVIFANGANRVAAPEVRQLQASLGMRLGNGAAAALLAQTTQIDAAASLEGGRELYSLRRTPPRQAGSPFGADVITIVETHFTHINSIRRILSAYVQAGFGRSPEEADALSERILFYKARIRGQYDYLFIRFQRSTREQLDFDKCGIDRQYQNWSGRTELIIPLELSSAGRLAPSETELKTTEATIAGIGASRPAPAPEIVPESSAGVQEEVPAEPAESPPAPVATRAEFPDLLRLIPALPQYRRDERPRADMIALGFFSVGAYAWYSYSRALAIEAQANSDPYATLASDQNYQTAYRQEMNRVRLSGYAAIALYCYHLLDEFYINAPGAGGETPLSRGAWRFQLTEVNRSLDPVSQRVERRIDAALIMNF